MSLREELAKLAADHERTSNPNVAEEHRQAVRNRVQTLLAEAKTQLALAEAQVKDVDVDMREAWRLLTLILPQSDLLPQSGENPLDEPEEPAREW